MDVPRVIAGIFVGSGALLLIYLGNVTEGATLLGVMVGFFVGENNGKRKTLKDQSS